MTGETAPVTMYVTYPTAPDATFDRAYYVETHLPLVMDHWAQYGLLSATAFFPQGDQGGMLACAELQFRDSAAVDAAFGSPETPAVLGDIANFTNVTPVRTRMEPF